MGRGLGAHEAGQGLDPAVMPAGAQLELEPGEREREGVVKHAAQEPESRGSLRDYPLPSPPHKGEGE